MDVDAIEEFFAEFSDKPEEGVLGVRTKKGCPRMHTIEYETERIESWKKVYEGEREKEYKDGPVSGAITASLDDFYNLMHLIKKAWSNEKYRLKMEEAGYTIYDTDGHEHGWLGVKEKRTAIQFILYSCSSLLAKAREKVRPMAFGMFGGFYIFSTLELADVVKAQTAERQLEIVKQWVSETIEKFL
jgi:hypothetical protein